MKNIHEVKGSSGRPKGKCKDAIKSNFKEKGVRMWIGFTWLILRSSGRILWRQNEYSGSINAGNFWSRWAIINPSRMITLYKVTYLISDQRNLFT
jgi:hypothetical protein